MFFLLKNCFMIIFFILLTGCGFTNLNSTKLNYITNVKIETINDQNNLILKENLYRVFRSKTSQTYKFLLKANILFSSSDTLSISGLNSLTRTMATINYKLYDIDTKKLVNEGSVKSFSSVGSTSKSLYTNDISLKHIKERLNLNISKKLYMHLNVILRRLK